MPRASKTSKSSTDIKPYVRSSTSPSPSFSPQPLSPTAPAPKTPRKKAKKEPTNNGSGQKRPWTSEEYLQLFEKVIKAGGGIKTWEGAVEGRTANQCYQAWLGTVTPFIRKALAEKAGR